MATVDDFEKQQEKAKATDAERAEKELARDISMTTLMLVAKAPGGPRDAKNVLAHALRNYAVARGVVELLYTEATGGDPMILELRTEMEELARKAAARVRREAR